jgi:enamine deaminase RidA (YjgF/YER057c/UK114 family)
MSNLKYFNYSDFTLTLSNQSHYSQAVRIGDRIECSGQGTASEPRAPLTTPEKGPPTP